MDADFWKNLYEREWDHRGASDVALGIPVGAITVLGGALYYLAANFASTSFLISCVFWASVCAAYIFLIASVIYVIRSIYGYEYLKIPTAEMMNKQLNDLCEYYLAIDGNDNRAAEDFEEQLTARYIEAAERNAWNNINKGAYIDKCKRALICLIISASIASPLCIVSAHMGPSSGGVTKKESLNEQGQQAIEAGNSETKADSTAQAGADV